MKKAAKQIIISRPSKAEVEKYLDPKSKSEHYDRQEDALNKLLKLLPENKDLSDVLLKASSINDFYSTNIFAIYPVAQLILSIKDFDQRVRLGDTTLVDELGKVTIKDKERSIYSFATKYCCHHNPLDFPIYDSYVEKVLCYFNKKYKFSSFKRADLKEYTKFKDVLLEFRSYFQLEQFNLRQLDQYLWLLGKTSFQKYKVNTTSLSL